MNDTMAPEIKYQIRRYYQKDPIGDLSETPWERPPIENVFCAYGVNMNTPIGGRFKRGPYENDWDVEEIYREEGNKVTGADGTEELLSNRKSGDGTVPYYSLSWCHTWMGSKVNVTRLPQTSLYSASEVLVQHNVPADTIPPAGLATTFFEERRKKGDGGVYHTAVWELDQVTQTFPNARTVWTSFLPV